MHKGQALMVVLLVLGVVLTVGLAVVSRSVTEVSISTTAEESTRALEAAEAGVEKSLAGVGSFAAPEGGSATLPNASVDVVNTNIAGGSVNSYVLPYDLEPGDVATVDTTGLSGKVRVCWGKDNTNPYLELMVYAKDASNNVVMRRYMEGPSGNNIVLPKSGGGGNCPGGAHTYDYNDDFDVVGSGESAIMMRVRMYGYVDQQPIGFRILGGGNFVVQGTDTISTGTAGSTSKRVRVTQVKPDVPFMFDSALFSGTGLIK